MKAFAEEEFNPSIQRQGASKIKMRQAVDDSTRKDLMSEQYSPGKAEAEDYSPVAAANQSQSLVFDEVSLRDSYIHGKERFAYMSKDRSSDSVLQKEGNGASKGENAPTVTQEPQIRNPDYTDEEGFKPSQKPQETSFLKTVISKIKGDQTPRADRYNVGERQQQSHDSDQQTEDTHHMISSEHDVPEFQGYRMIMAMMIFTPVYIIVFYVPQPIFAVLHILGAISDDQYNSLSTSYCVLLSLIFIAVNVYFYYQIKTLKRKQVDRTDSELNRNFHFTSNTEERALVNSRNLIKILFLSSLAVIGMLDTQFDIVFLSLCYVSGVVWLAVVVGLAYIYTFFDKVHSLRKLYGLMKDLHRKRFEKNVLTESSRAIQLYSSCLSISAVPMAETMCSYNHQNVDLLRRVLVFEGGHVCIQKTLFIIFKVSYYFIEGMTFKSSMVSYAIPFNIMCTILTVLYVILKLRDLRLRKSNGGVSDPSGEQNKVFHSQMTQNCIKFKQSVAGDLSPLSKVIQKIEGLRKLEEKDVQLFELTKRIDKIKVRLLEGVPSSFTQLLKILRQQHFIREVSIYKMKLTNLAEFDCISEMMLLRKHHGLLKISFKDCTIAESMIPQLTSQLNFEEGDEQSIISDLTIQMRVDPTTDFEILYQGLRQLSEKHPVTVLFEPLFASKTKDKENFIDKITPQQLQILSQKSAHAKTLAAEYQQIKRYYLVQNSRQEQSLGTLRFFKDYQLQSLFDQVMDGTLQEESNGEMDLITLRNTMTHSYHQERFIQLLIRGMEDRRGQVRSLQVRLKNNQGLFEKQGNLLLSLEYFKRIINCTPENRLIKLHVNMTKLSIQDAKAIEELFLMLSEAIEGNQRSLKELIFTDTQFDLNSGEEKDFYSSLSFPNFHTVILHNCKFVCYDSFERFFGNLGGTENSIKRFEIHRLNCSVTAKGFKEFLLSQETSLETLVLNGVHKNILSRKHHKKILSSLAKLPFLKHLSLQKNQLDFERLQALVSHMVSHESFQDLISLDLSHNLIENNSILTIYKMLKERVFSLNFINLSGNAINDEGLNLLLKGKLEQDQTAPLTKGLICNDMKEKNFLVNNPKSKSLDRLEVSSSFSLLQDPSVAVSGFSMSGVLHSGLLTLDISNNNLNEEQIILFSQRLQQFQQSSLVTLNLQRQKFEETAIEYLSKFVEDSRTLKNLNLSGCKLGDSLGSKMFKAWISGKSKSRGSLDLSLNLLSGNVFADIVKDKGEKGVPLEPTQCSAISFAKNLLDDEAVGLDFISIVVKYRLQVSSLDLSDNLLGKATLILLRQHGDAEEFCDEIDISGNSLSLLKSASIMELGASQIKMKYTQEVATPKKNKKL